MPISSFTLSSRGKSCLFVGNVGAGWRIGIWSGRCVENFSLNSAKSFLGRNVNLHLKDGSVIVNVHLAAIRRNEFGKGSVVEYVPYGNRKMMSIPLKNIAWAELLNLNLIQTGG